MNTNRAFFYFLLFVILLLLIGLAYLLRSARSMPANMALENTAASAAGSALEPVLNIDDFALMLEPPKTDVPSAQDILQRPAASAPASVGPARQAAAPAPAVTVPVSAALAPAHAAGAPALRTPVQTARPVFPGVQAPAAAAAQARAAAPALPAQEVLKGSGPGPSVWPGAAEALAAYQQGAEERGNIYASTLPRQTREEEKKLNQRLQSFSAGLERAIASAVSAKTKREQNIEKYLARARGEAASMDTDVRAVQTRQAGGPAQEVMQQLASQSKSIVNDVRANYGDKAASEAESIMGDFQKEMAETLNAPGDLQEKQIRAQAVNNKYNNKLQQFNQEQALDKMEEQMRAENEKYLKKIEQTYGPQTAANMRPVMEEYLAKRKQIWATPQAEEEAVAQMLALNEQQRKAQEEVVRQTAPDASAGQLTALQNEVAKQSILEEARKAQSGETSSPLFYQSEQARAQNEAAWQKEGAKIVEGFKTLGDQAVQQAQSQMDSLISYRRQLRQEAAEKGLTVAEVNRRDMEKTEEVNRNLQQLRLRETENRYNQQYEEQFKDLPDDIKSQARSIWQQYNKERASLLERARNQQEYEQRMEQLGKEEAQQLQELGRSASE